MHAIEYCHCFACMALPGKTGGLRQPVRAHIRAQIGIAQQPRGRGGKRLSVGWIDQQGGAARDLRQAAGIAARHRAAAGHGFQYRHPKALEQRWKDQTRRAAIQRRQIAVWAVAKEAHLIL